MAEKVWCFGPINPFSAFTPFSISFLSYGILAPIALGRGVELSNQHLL